MIDVSIHTDALCDSSQLTLEAIDLVRNRLPRESYPQQTIERYPRIVNMTALLWDEPAGFRQYYDELLNDERGDRQGFPFEVLVELTNLREAHEHSHPEKRGQIEYRLDALGRRI
ncbi:hypothetical protein EZJ19_13435 [Parasulfuritortus cantonensis]|uniref:Uncharacterized protein n=1 Tax=Parasulfuritortus cantonensis TaxID=2528202 RepID=A0A4R1B2B5_9PROT|nr:hypothetical protein [Parasulfuritortus cantonensis]TCJ11961.1 hypothetical protein EZJ19_13435 [Parasulfuritortus cantonensis]